MKKVVGALVYYAYNHFISRIPSYWLRRFYLRRILGYSIAHDASIHMNTFVTGRRITIGSHTVINRRCYLDGRGQLVIGQNASLSPEVYVLSLTHDPDDPAFAVRHAITIIEDDVWIGARALILPGVRLCKGSIIGAGAVVSHDIPEGAVAVGNPARVIRKRRSQRADTLAYQPLLDSDITL